MKNGTSKSNWVQTPQHKELSRVLPQPLVCVTSQVICTLSPKNTTKEGKS